jgi:hypothetical protein
MAIEKRVEGTKVTYVGTINISEGMNETFVVARGASRAMVEWALHVEYARRLEALAEDAALLRHLINTDDSEVDDNPLLSERAAKLASHLADELWQLRNSEPGISLCGEYRSAGPRQHLVAGPGQCRNVEQEEDAYDPMDWDVSTDALERCRWSALRDHAADGAETAAYGALVDAGITGPGVRCLVVTLTNHFIRERKQYARGRDTGVAVPAHARVVIALARDGEHWSRYRELAGREERDEKAEAEALREVSDAYDAALRAELASPDERKSIQARAAAMDSAFAIIAGRHPATQPKRTIAARVARRPRKARAATRRARNVGR